MRKVDYFNLTGGLNLTDSPFTVQDNQATYGWNYDYLRTGAVRKRLGHGSALNSSPLTGNSTLGMDIYNPATGSKTLLRATDQYLQTIDTAAYTATNILEDTVAAASTFFTSGSTQPVVFAPFNTSNSGGVWAAGGGYSGTLLGYNGSKATANGSVEPTGTITTAVSGSAQGGLWVSTNYYTYAIVRRKASTQVLSNASLDVVIHITDTTSTCTVTLPAETDTTKYDERWIYRSAGTSASTGSKGFTTGDLVAQLPSTINTFVDYGTYISTTNVVPRAGNTSLDNSQLPQYTHGVYNLNFSQALVTSNSITITVNGTNYVTSFTTDNATTLAAIATAIAANAGIKSAVVGGASTITVTGNNATVLTLSGSVTGGASQATITVSTITPPATLQAYNVVTTFKRRLVTAQGSTLYLSDLDKPESWPTSNYITLPTGGNITAIAVIGYNAYFSGNTDEYLVIFKDKEIWVLTGDNSANWVLKFIDAVGCPAQRLVIPANGYIAWVDYRGVFLWGGSGKPIYCSRPIEAIFGYSGDLDKSNLALGWGRFYRQSNQIIWYLSHRTQGVQKFAIKMDTRLNMPKATEELDQRVIEGVFNFDNQVALYAGVSFLPTGQMDEIFYAGDASANIYRLFSSSSDPSGVGVDFEYQTKALDQQALGQGKKYFKVIAWVDDVTSANLNLEYWSDYKVATQDSRTLSAPIREQFRHYGQPGKQLNTAALYDIALWDTAYYDDGAIKPKPIIFNLPSNNDGDSIMLRFYNSDAGVPITLHGFSILYEEMPVKY